MQIKIYTASRVQMTRHELQFDIFPYMFKLSSDITRDIIVGRTRSLHRLGRSGLYLRTAHWHHLYVVTKIYGSSSQS